MQKDIGILTRIGLMLVLLISLSSLCIPSAEAVIRDQAIFGRLQDQRNTLLIREKRLMEDYDDLQEQIRNLTKGDNDPRLVDELYRSADKKYADLKEVRYNLHQVEMKLM